MRNSVGIVLSAIAIAFSHAAYATGSAADCTQAEQFYQLGMQAGTDKDFETAAGWLKKASALCESYNTWHLLARAEQKLGNFDGALSAYKSAVKLAESTDQQAITQGRYGETLALAGQREEALTMLQQARELHSKPTPEWMTALAMEIDKSLAERPMSKSQITRGLGTQRFGLLDFTNNKVASSTAKPTQSPGRKAINVPAAKVNIRINFEYNSTVVDETSQPNIQALADALADANYVGRKFLLVGHCDIRGGEIFNKNLSLQRAEAIEAQLVKRYPSLRGRIVTEGAGSSRPLYEGASEDIFKLNRRLEVRVID